MTQQEALEPEVIETSKAKEVAGSTSGMSTPDYLGIGSLVIGVFNLCSWFIPLCGCPLTLVGIGLGIAGLKSEKYKWMAIVGLIVSILGFIATLINGILGAYMGYQNAYTYDSF